MMMNNTFMATNMQQLGDGFLPQPCSEKDVSLSQLYPDISHWLEHMDRFTERNKTAFYTLAFEFDQYAAFHLTINQNRIVDPLDFLLDTAEKSSERRFHDFCRRKIDSFDSWLCNVLLGRSSARYASCRPFGIGVINHISSFLLAIPEKTPEPLDGIDVKGRFDELLDSGKAAARWSTICKTGKLRVQPCGEANEALANILQKEGRISTLRSSDEILLSTGKSLR